MKRSALFLLVVFALTGPVPAQENGAPRRGSPERRAQRAERLRSLTDPAGPVGQLLGSLSGGAESGSSALDVLKLNEGIVAILQPLLDEEGGLEYLRLRFDPAETNLNRDTVRLICAAKLRSSAWSSEPTQVDLDLRGSMQRRDDGRPRGLLDGSLRFQTDVIALANRAMTRFADRLDRRAQQGSVREAPLNADEAFRQRMREKLAATPPLETMDDVIDLVLSFSGLRLTSINDRIAELKHESDSTPDERLRLDLAKQLDSARRERDRMLDLHPRVDRDDSGRAVAMTLTMDRSRFDENTQVERLKVEITESRVALELVGSTMQGMELYSLFKPIVVNTLTRVQTRDPETARMGRGLLRGYLGQLRGAFGEPPSDDGPVPETLPPPKRAKD